MYGKVGLLIWPRAPLYHAVGGLVPRHKHERAADPAAALQNVKARKTNILFNKLRGRIAVFPPLGGVAVLRHKSPSFLVYLKELGQVVCRSFTHKLSHR